MVPQLAFNQVSETADGAADLLSRGGAYLRRLNQANVFCRLILGRQLRRIQERQLWATMEWSDPQRGGESASPAKYRSWGEFMKHGFPQIAGLGPETGYAAMVLAKAAVFHNLSEAELRKFGSLSNAIHLAKLERGGVPISAELVTAAQTVSTMEFRHLTGAGKKATVEVAVESRETAVQLERIVRILKPADPDALRVLGDILERALLLGGDCATDAVDAVIAACHEQWLQEEEPTGPLTARAVSQ